MTPQETATLDQIRAGFREALDREPCTCGECLTNAQLEILLGMTDEQLLATLEEATP